jgi:Na+-translocating ferredoxin:NAD+ oxidoreductase RnfG subunit
MEVTKMNKGLVSGLVLLTIGLVCGLLLAVVNFFTAPRITEEENKIKYAALAEFYDLEDYDLSEAEGSGDFGTIFILKAKGTDTIEALVYTVSAQGYSDSTKVQMLIAVNADLSVEGAKVVQQQETTGFGADFIEDYQGNNFSVTDIDDLTGIDSVAGVTKTSDAIRTCFELVAQRVTSDFGGGLDE